jgi:hypothetical protein
MLYQNIIKVGGNAKDKVKLSERPAICPSPRNPLSLSGGAHLYLPIAHFIVFHSFVQFVAETGENLVLLCKLICFI